MTPLPDDTARAEILARLAASRAELQRIFEPTRGHGGETADSASGGAGSGGFPRSRTMQLLLSGRGLGTLGAVAVGLLVSRPALALRLLRLLPAGAVAKTLLLRAIGAMRSRSQSE
jgi:hypothetical protein